MRNKGYKKTAWKKSRKFGDKIAPSPRTIKWYKGYADVRMDRDGWVALFTEVLAHRYYLERLLPHEIAHCIAFSQSLMRHSTSKNENYADNFAYNHERRKAINKDVQ